MMMNEWRVFKKPVELKLSTIPTLVECCMRLHNFCIHCNESEWHIADLTPDLLEEHIPLYEEYLDDIDAPAPGIQTPVAQMSARCSSVRETITKQLAAHCLSRPYYNRKRNYLGATKH
jgi:hypothetical protein